MIFEQENFYDEDLEPVVFSNQFAFFNIEGGTTSKKYPGLSHCFIPRYDIFKEEMQVVSPMWEKFSRIFYKYIFENNIKLDKICRAAVNLTDHYQGADRGDAHIDHNFPHKSFLYYINQFDGGNTYLFNEQYDGENIYRYDGLSVYKEIESKKNKVVCFDGLHYHAQGFCAPNQWRCAMIVTFTEK
jgi:hypothetical protein